MEIENIYRQLRGIHLCESGYDFSEKYLGKSKSYYSVMKSRKEEPSIEALVILEVSLKEKAQVFEGDRYEIFKKRRNELLSLSEAVGKIRISRCIGRLKELQYGGVT